MDMLADVVMGLVMATGTTTILVMEADIAITLAPDTDRAVAIVASQGSLVADPDQPSAESPMNPASDLTRLL